jgi:hypothetical protein
LSLPSNHDLWQGSQKTNDTVGAMMNGFAKQSKSLAEKPRIIAK